MQINKRIGQNITAYRKQVGLTQAELAEKINYSDKSVSKWESGGGAPDSYILMQLAQIFGVTVGDLIAEEPPKKLSKHPNIGLHLLIMALSSGIVWLVATCLFVLLGMLPVSGGLLWTIFVFAAPVNAILFLVLSAVWKYKRLTFIATCLTIWGSLSALYCLLRFVVGMGGSVWLVFLLGAPLQVLDTLWAFFRYSLFKKRSALKE